MQRRRTKMVKLNDKPALEKLLQESYTDSCQLISDTGVIITDLTINAQPADADDLAKISKEKINALKVRDSAIKLKLDIAKLMNDVIKNDGDEGKTVDNVNSENGAQISDDMFERIRQNIERSKNE